ncbi:MAG: type II toxin-antitoxin system Phd/YefM family antitoxin [Patescibacteria group bacterium]
MNMAITATKARQNFFQLIEKADKPGASVTITIDGNPRVVMMPLEDFEGWQETLEIMSDKKLMKGIKEALTGKKTYTEADIKKEFNIQ